MKRKVAFLLLCSMIAVMACTLASAQSGEPINYEPARICKGLLTLLRPTNLQTRGSRPCWIGELHCEYFGM